jgi:hypothetical protein
MKIRSRAWVIATGCLIAAGLIVDGWCPIGLVSSEVEARRVVRPVARPHSAAGVARRTTRRHIRRSTVYVATLPRGCSTVVIEGTTLHNCGGTYYQADGGQYVVVYVD